MVNATSALGNITDSHISKLSNSPFLHQKTYKLKFGDAPMILRRSSEDPPRMTRVFLIVKL
jgi:hypothetical protein